MSNHATAATSSTPPQASPRALTPSAIRARLEAQSSSSAASSHSNSPALNSSANAHSTGSCGDRQRGEQQRHQRKLSQVAYGASKANAQAKTNSASPSPSPADVAAAQLLRGAHSASPPQLQSYNKHATLPADVTKVRIAQATGIRGHSIRSGRVRRCLAGTLTVRIPLASFCMLVLHHTGLRSPAATYSPRSAHHDYLSAFTFVIDRHRHHCSCTQSRSRSSIQPRSGRIERTGGRRDPRGAGHEACG